MFTNKETKMQKIKEPQCAWCGYTGNPMNKVLIYEQSDGSMLCECEFCSSGEWFRRKASNGEGN